MSPVTRQMRASNELRQLRRMAWMVPQRGWIAVPEEVVDAFSTEGFARRPLLFDVGPRIAPTVPPMGCTQGSPGERCPRRARYADGTRQRICQLHAEQRVRIGGLTALLPGDRARFLAASAGYASSGTDDES